MPGSISVNYSFLLLYSFLLIKNCFILTRGHFFIAFLDREEEGERDREGNIDVREEH